MIGKIQVTSTGYDPNGPPVRDPTLGLTVYMVEWDRDYHAITDKGYLSEPGDVEESWSGYSYSYYVDHTLKVSLTPEQARQRLTRPKKEQKMSNAKLVEVVQKYGVVWAGEGKKFTLASGAQSDFFFDFSRVVMVPEGMAAVVDAINAAIPTERIQAIGGPSSGADPIVGAVLASLKYDIRGFTVRKEPKGRGPGAGEMYEGYLDAGDEVVMVEDVTTSGGSVLKAIKVVEDRGAKVVKVISLLDRLAGAKSLLQGYDFVALTTKDDFNLTPPY